MLKPCRRASILILTWALPICAAAQCNLAPQPVDDTALHQGDPIYVDVLANDVEPDGERLAVSSVTTSCDGSVAESFGVVIMTPTSTRAEACTITYEVSDERGDTAMATVQVSDSGLLFKDGFESGDTSAWIEEEQR